MPLPTDAVAEVQRWCDARVPAAVRDKVRVELGVAARHLTVFECRPPWVPGATSEWTRFPVARMRFTASTGLWSLYWRDRNTRFHAYDRVEATPDVTELCEELDRDPTAIFWG